MIGQKYSTAHSRVLKVKGRASNQSCVECGAQAHDWSYSGLDEFAVCDTSQKGRGLVTYSLDPAFYEPRCRACHQRGDAEARRLNALCHEVYLAELELAKVAA